MENRIGKIIGLLMFAAVVFLVVVNIVDSNQKAASVLNNPSTPAPAASPVNTNLNNSPQYSVPGSGDEGRESERGDR